MAQYIRKEGDRAYRKVNVAVTGEPDFTDFVYPGECVNFPDQMVVLEILRSDGSTQLHYYGSRRSVQYLRSGREIIRLSQAVPTERLWVRRLDGRGIAYRVPADLPVKDGHKTMYISGGASQVELFGDRYFEMIFDILN